MKKLILSGIALAVATFSVADLAWAHGGQYRGPGDTVPPNPGGRGGRTPGPSGPSTPGPGGPSTPGPGGPSTPGPAGPGTGGPGGPGPAAGPSTGGIQLDDDLNRWEFWWEFNKDPFIKLKESIHSGGVVSESDEFYLGSGTQRIASDTLKPSETQILQTILPKLHQALESTDNRDIVSSCMVAMAKVGKNTDQINILEAFKKRLTEKDQEIRETAAVALGISQMTEAIPALIDLAKDTPAGRKLCARDAVDYRTRAFSIYGLGLVAWASSDNAVKAQVFGALKEILDSDKAPERDIRVATINAVALVRPDPSSEDGRKLLKESLDSLDAYWTRELGPGEQLIQAHVPHAVAKLYEKFDPQSDTDLAKRREDYKARWLEEVEGKAKVKRSHISIVQSAIVGLGRLCGPVDAKNKEGNKLDLQVAKALDEYAAKGSDEQGRYFSLMALGQMGGPDARTMLIEVLRKGSKALERPWAAVSLGVLAFREMETAGVGAQVDTLLGQELVKQLENKNPSTRAAMAIGLGLCKYKDGGTTIQQLLETDKNRDELAGYMCVALALMGQTEAVQQIQDIVSTSTRRPIRLRQAAIALGKLGDKSAAQILIKMLTDDGEPDLAKMSAIASALGFIGDQRTIDPLVKMLFDTNLPPLSRAFSAVALGGVADKELLPWNSKLAVNMNYRAAVETLTNQAVGILDIL
ncbi:MAG: HEAT repeat domain-containing protein [Planctomycetes bacterium]|nr:HEAT repeat domain-containing protein [Planctomycetota bacterium]